MKTLATVENIKKSRKKYTKLVHRLLTEFAVTGYLVSGPD